MNRDNNKKGVLHLQQPLTKRFSSIPRIYSVCGFRITHGLAPQSAETEPVNCFNTAIAGHRRYPLRSLYHKISRVQYLRKILQSKNFSTLIYIICRFKVENPCMKYRLFKTAKNSLSEMIPKREFLAVILKHQPS